MPEITQQQAKEFLNGISNKDSVAIIHHDDSDGFCSGILFYDHCITKGATTKALTYNYSKTSMKNLPLDSFNKIIITDIPSEITKEEIKLIKDKQIFYTDHHPKFPLPEEVLQLITTDQGYIPSSRTAYELTEKKEWLSMIGVIADSAEFYEENLEYINDFLKRQNLTLKEFQTKYVHPFSDVTIYFKKTPEKIFPILSNIETLEDVKQLEKYSKEIEKELKKHEKKYEEEKEELGETSFYYYNSKFSINKPLINILTKKYQERVLILLSSKGDKINISARNQSGKVRVDKLLGESTSNLKNAKGGGHPKASGGQIQAKDLEKFKQNIKDYFSK
jgi:single-stranded DNA-specific DHH superfamily exonuclease